jgi:KUP system potassium uptake protein
MEPSIHFAEQAPPSAQNHASSQSAIGGVVRLRSREQTRGYKRSIDLGKLGELEDAEDEDAGLRNEADYKHSQVCAAWADVLYKWLSN